MYTFLLIYTPHPATFFVKFQSFPKLAAVKMVLIINIMLLCLLRTHILHYTTTLLMDK